MEPNEMDIRIARMTGDRGWVKRPILPNRDSVNYDFMVDGGLVVGRVTYNWVTATIIIFVFGRNAVDPVIEYPLEDDLTINGELVKAANCFYREYAAWLTDQLTMVRTQIVDDVSSS